MPKAICRQKTSEGEGSSSRCISSAKRRRSLESCASSFNLSAKRRRALQSCATSRSHALAKRCRKAKESRDSSGAQAVLQTRINLVCAALADCVSPSPLGKCHKMLCVMAPYALSEPQDERHRYQDEAALSTAPCTSVREAQALAEDDFGHQSLQSERGNP
eukprot:gnl/MRDRNA2_/MRDRNA2_80314_c0_seq1.p1 gnl/MRDRNA2_/MRDRNA2_80314_c0~~gnl/MRDRNA2_/MRDRNA2_80314_c0_seq1.p1  ORF type:complete len:171 (-),score=22.65 gnl/MRDRNA2_/MRDRNA2_80314_c0_seq1:375-857(-)